MFIQSKIIIKSVLDKGKTADYLIRYDCQWLAVIIID